VITATHTRKARRDLGVCPLCRTLMNAGTRVCRVGRGGSWLHVDCFVQRYRTTDERTT
jgi:hypothetical protein